MKRKKYRVEITRPEKTETLSSLDKQDLIAEVYILLQKMLEGENIRGFRG